MHCQPQGNFFPLFYRFFIWLLSLTIVFICSSSHASTRLQLATIYQEPEQINDYWVSEKLDGIRGHWDGKTLRSKQGNQINAPSWFTRNWPNTSLDGELWIARHQFEQVSGCVRKKTPTDCWNEVTFNLFDLPENKGSFTKRIKAMKALVALRDIPHLNMIPQTQYSSIEELMSELDSIVDAQGEGLMLHHKEAQYKAGRNTQIMKLKRYDDDEAIVLEHIPGKGKYTNQLGSLKVKTKEGIIFKIGSGFSDEDRKNPPLLNSVVTFKYVGKTQRGVPRFASFIRVRSICHTSNCLF